MECLCCVCLEIYNKLNKKKLPYVLTSCGHSLCLECAENIVNSDNKRCPICRDNYTNHKPNYSLISCLGDDKISEIKKNKKWNPSIIQKAIDIKLESFKNELVQS